MKKVQNYCVALLFILTFINKAISQSGPIPQDPVTLPTPNVAALQMYGEIPVSKFTGVPGIEVPLYTLKEKEITVPITLSYHASGFRPDQHPGWVGESWSLQAGGVISRIVHHLPDDDDDLLPTDNKPIGFLFRYPTVNPPGGDWSSANYIINTAIGNNSINYVVDAEPDEFDFNFGGHSGKFFMDYTGVYRAEGDKGLQITLINPQSPLISCPLPLDTKALNNPFSASYMHCFAGFIITTTDGTQYVFGGTNAAIEYSKDFYNQGTSTWIANAWHLTNIIGPDGSNVTFNYMRGPLINQLTSTIYLRTVNTSPTSPASWFNIFELNPPTCSSFANPLVSGVLPFSGQLLSPVYLRQISSEQSTINFTNSATQELTYPFNTQTGNSVYPTGLPSVQMGQSGNYYYTSDKFYDLYTGGYENGNPPVYPQIFTQSLIWQELDNIQIIKNENNQVLKQFAFTYSHDSNTRLMLLNLQEISALGKFLPAYQFFYDNSKPLPQYFAKQNDHWGFWNGTTAALSITSSGQINNPTGYYSYREPNSNYALAGTLNRIIYPSGAATIFTYEPNTYSAEVDVTRWNPLIADATDKIAGGLRIKKITTIDPNFPLQPKTKQYYYLKNYTPSTGLTGSSSGVLGGKAQYYWPNYTVTDIASNQTTITTVFSSQSVLPASENSMGSHIGYSEVEEQNADGSINDYQYTNFNANTYNNDNGHLDDPYVTNLQNNASPYVSFNSKALERGKLLSEQNYSSNGILLKTLKYTYAAQATNAIRALWANRVFTCNGGTLSYNEGTAWNYYIYPYLPSSMTTSIFDVTGANPQTVTKNINYDPLHAFTSLESVTDSRGRQVNFYYRYASDLASGISSPVITQPLSLMISKNMIEIPIETIQTKMLNGNEMITSATVKTFKGVNVTPPSGTSQLSVKPLLEYYFESNIPFQKSNYVPYNLNPSGNAGPPEQYQIDPNLKPRVEYTNFDSRGNISQFNDNATNISTSSYYPHYNSYLWGYNKLFPIAKIANTGNINLTNEYYAENFEESTITGVTTDGTAHTGLNYFKAPSFTVNFTPPNSRGYLLSYWYKSVGIWKYSGAISYSGTSYTLSGGDGAFDDIRIYAADAEMSTYTYSRLIGMTSAIDSKGKTTYYDYDDFQRLMNIRAIDITSQTSSIVKNYNYNYPSRINQTPNYQNDGNVYCAIDANGNGTGYQVTEQSDQNVLSSSYNAVTTTSTLNSGCPVTVSFTSNNTGNTNFTASFSGGPAVVTITLLAGQNQTFHIQVYNNYTLSLSPQGAQVNRTFVLGNHTVQPPSPGAIFNNVNITAGNADLSLVID